MRLLAGVRARRVSFASGGSSVGRRRRAESTPSTARQGRFSRRGSRSSSTSHRHGSATPSSASGRTGPRSACPSRATGTRGTCTCRAIRPVRLPRARPTATRPSSASWRSTTSGRPRAGSPSADGSLREGRREVFRRAGQPSRQLRRLRLEVTTAGTAVRVGPKKDIVGTWAKPARSARPALRRHQPFGARLALVPDRLWLRPRRRRAPASATTPSGSRKEDGTGKWWEGLDPQELYTGRNMVMPDGITTITAANAVARRERPAMERKPAAAQPGVRRTAGSCAARNWSTSTSPTCSTSTTPTCRSARPGSTSPRTSTTPTSEHGGKLEAVLNAKGLKPEHVGAWWWTSSAASRRPASCRSRGRPTPASATGTTTARIFDSNRYKTADTVIQTLVDIVSKNGNLLLNIPVRGDGTIDDGRAQSWRTRRRGCAANGEAIYGTRPLSVFGEGPPDVKGSANFNESSARPTRRRTFASRPRGTRLRLRAGVAGRWQTPHQDLAPRPGVSAGHRPHRAPRRGK